MKGRFDGLDAGGCVFDLLASDYLCGMENKLFVFSCLLRSNENREREEVLFLFKMHAFIER